jgi:hypothetical protein
MRDARIELDWADGTYSFRLGWGQLAELQEKTDAGPYFLLNRLYAGNWRIEDISQIIRLGLIGGDEAMKPVQALGLVRRYVEARPPMENLPFAVAILTAGVIGAEDEPLGEQEAPKRKSKRSTASRMGKSASEPSTDQAQ